MNKGTIIYISGEGHSGTTLLDIILGAQENAFSSGELIFFVQKGLKNKEYCACGNPVPECDIWSKINEEWERKRSLDLDEYIQIQSELTSKKKVLSTYFKLKNPSGKIAQYLEDTEKLYSIIFKVTDSKIIIESSKAPERLLILKKLNFDIMVLHMIRRFGDVLNSYKKNIEKDLKAGIEHDLKPLNTSYVFSSWSLKNLLTYLVSRDVSYKKIWYDQLVLNPIEELSALVNGDSDFIHKLEERGPFYPKHLVAGNQIRMKENLYIAEKPMNNSYSRLNKQDKMFARLVDYFLATKSKERE